MQCGFFRRTGVAYCPTCGGRLPEVIQRTAGPVEQYGRPVVDLTRTNVASRGSRLGGGSVDILLPLILTPLAIIFLPFSGKGQSMYGLIITAFWLLRDFDGASPGKRALKTVVMDQFGGPSTVAQRVLRNAPLACPGLILAIPWIGPIFGPVLGLLVLAVESLALVASGRRIGDMMAGTRVDRAEVRGFSAAA